MSSPDDSKTMYRQAPRSVTELLALPDDLRALSLFLLKAKAGATLPDVLTHMKQPEDACLLMLETLLGKGIIQREIEQDSARYFLRAGWKRGANTGTLPTE